MKATGTIRSVPQNVHGKVAWSLSCIGQGNWSTPLAARCWSARRVGARPPVDHLPLDDPAGLRHFSRVVDKIDTGSLEGKKLLLLSPEDLRTLQQRLLDAQELLTDLAGALGLQQVLISINQEISKALVTHLATSFLGTSSSSATSTPEEGQALDVTFLAALFGELEQALAAPASYLFHSPWSSFFLKDSKLLSQEGYLTSENNRFLFVLVEDRPADGSFVKHAPALQALRAHMQALRRDFPDVQAGVTGSMALGSDEMVSSQHDTALATVISLIGVGLLYIAIF